MAVTNVTLTTMAQVAWILLSSSNDGAVALGRGLGGALDHMNVKEAVS
jgi:D-alanyl-D-alanine carboxypeptidase